MSGLMNFARLRPVAGTLLLAALTAGTAFAQWDPFYGQLASQGDDTLVTGIAIPFAFPLPGGGTTMAISASTNGWVKLVGAPSSTSSELGESSSLLLSGDPSIRVYWDDLTGAAGSGITPPGMYVDVRPAKVVVTWLSREFATANRVEAQLQLFPSGGFQIYHAAIGSGDCLVGVSPGGGAADPGGSNLSAGVIGGGTTIYELFTTTSPDDLLGQVLSFVPNAVPGYDVVVGPGLTATGQADPAGVSRGTGCGGAGPGFGVGYVEENFSSATTDACDLAGQSILFQRLPNGGYSAVLTGSLVWETGYTNRVDNAAGIWQGGSSGDDSLTVPQALGFSASFWDNAPINNVEVCSNGRIYLGTGGSTSFTASETTLFTGTCVAAPYSRDLDCRTASIPATGGLYVDQFPAMGMTPAKLVVTYDQIPPYTASPPASTSVTVQAQFFANGNVILSFMAVDPSLTGIVGFFHGGGSGSPTETDLSTALVSPGITVNPSPPAAIGHDADLIILGATPIARATDLAGGTIASALHVGVDQTALPLDMIGMPGCTAYTLALVVVLPLVPSGSTASTSLGLVPLDPTLIGGVLTTQALSVVPGANPLQILASNGWDSTIGRW